LRIGRDRRVLPDQFCRHRLVIAAHSLAGRGGIYIIVGG
jgi:hypothetical protein